MRLSNIVDGILIQSHTVKAVHCGNLWTTIYSIISRFVLDIIVRITNNILTNFPP